MAMYKHTNMYTLYTYADLRDACVQTYMHAHRERYTYDSCTHTHVHISTFIYKHRHAHMHPCTFVQLECTRHDVYYAGACTCTHICSSVHVWKLYDWIRHDKQEISLLVELQVSTVSWEYNNFLHSFSIGGNHYFLGLEKNTKKNSEEAAEPVKNKRRAFVCISTQACSSVVSNSPQKGFHRPDWDFHSRLLCTGCILMHWQK